MSIPNAIFHRVSRPARYTGNEWNSVVKDWDSASLRVALCYPDVYEVGMSNLALPVLYEILNALPGVVAERVFPPWPDMEAVLRENSLKLYSLESRHPLCEFDVVAFSFGYELTYTNALTVLDLGGVPLLREERTSKNPLVIAGGSAVANPEPMSDFIDAFFIGEAEASLPDMMEVIRAKRVDRTRLASSLAAMQGVYVPALYEVSPSDSGRLRPLAEAPASVLRRLIDELPPPPTRPIVPFLESVHDYASIEIQRGCTRGCRFCQAGMVYRPVRTRSREQIVAAAEEMVRNCGYSELSLLSLSSSDYPDMEQLVADLIPLCSKHNVSLSVPSLRLGPESVKLLEMLPGRRSSSFTFAPEAGSERLRRVVNKNVTEEDMFATLEALLVGGWTKLKLYFMIGLPTETVEDVAGIADLVRRVAGASKSLKVNVSVNLLVPKAHTPSQWSAQDTAQTATEKMNVLKRGLRVDRVKLSWSDPLTSQLEAALSRGDRRVGKAVLRAWQEGARYDAWGEHFSYETWHAAFESCGLAIADYANRERSEDEHLPWNHIDMGVSTQFLHRERVKMSEGENTCDCLVEECNGCGLQDRYAICPTRSCG
ncbi:TIGR03960 family B12-binding radical SAM protein [Chloroflexota bacterium]